jgi:ribosome-associated protein
MHTGDAGVTWRMADLVAPPGIAIPESELEERFVLSSGPGGQNVNKVASAVELRFDAARSPSLPDHVKQRLRSLAGRRLSKEGVLVLRGNRFREQQRNRDDVRARLADLIARAAIAPKRRKPTKPSRAARERRLDEKKARSKRKRERGKEIGLE